MHASATDHNACAYGDFMQTRLAKAKVLLVSQLLQVNALALRCSKFDVQSQAQLAHSSIQVLAACPVFLSPDTATCHSASSVQIFTN